MDSTARWDNNLIDTGKTLQFFFDACSAAGPNGTCPLYEPTPSAVRTRVNNILTSLASKPVPVRNTTSYAVVDFSAAKLALFASLYKPFDTFPRIATALAALEKGDASLLSAFSPPPQLKCTGCGNDESRERFEYAGDLSAGTAIRCSDGEKVNDSDEELRQHYERLAKVSEFADGWAGVRIACA